ncbi:hypothetical protein AKJ51_03480 [candidate division MSBL1 archaeon SCGC-AAA382A20]|uniref:Toprim domain-containing protein n=1 Tax=candidate division MSBL1 archaeon SCGC-AAA382A20 TaxID=1698280 RepID=A0A133VJF8_9EURY|nr:hypothetical protein AKJ51_03480 [candidate division MSBL1 archaeon SCGC-AAA382A20]
MTEQKLKVEKITRPTCKEELEELQKMYGVSNKKEMLALSSNNDPFNAGTPKDLKMARWFADVWNRCGFQEGVHLRRVHYRILSEEIKDYDDDPYENTQKAWNKLCKSGSKARYLKMVPAEAFEDHRNHDPRIHAEPREYSDSPSADFFNDEFTGDIEEYKLPEIPADISGGLDLNLPEPIVTGYDYEEIDQPYHLEVWIEKSTMNDVLIPVCKQYGMNLVTSVGFQSITSVVELLQRARCIGKPVRIFYIADFDPAGSSMAPAVARQIEYWMSEYALDEDIRVEKLGLTQEQIEELNLPRTPIKESDRRKENFEEKNGTGAVELDALEALHEGKLAQILRDAADKYYDTELENRLDQTHRQARREVERDWQQRTAPHREELQDIETRVRDIMDSYQAELQALSDRLEGDLAPYRDKLERIWQAIHDQADAMDWRLPARPEGDYIAENGDVLFDSKRDYMEQIQHYNGKS